MSSIMLPAPTGPRVTKLASPPARPLAGGRLCAKAGSSRSGHGTHRWEPHVGREICCSAAAQDEQSAPPELRSQLHQLRALGADTDSTGGSAASTLNSEDFERLYARETPLINRMLEEIQGKGQAFEQASDLGGPTEENRRAVREVVEEHFSEMSQGLLMVLAGYAQASYMEGHNEIGLTLETIREEALRMSLRHMPPEMQAMDRLVSMFPGDKEARVDAAKAMAIAEAEALAAAEAGEEPSEPRQERAIRTDLATLRRTATQLIEDMEELEAIVDTSLLAKMCIVREEIDEAAGHLGLLEIGSPYHGLMCASWRLLPAGPSAFVKELVPVSNPDKRRALLAECVLHDFLANPRDPRGQHWRREKVRPGRLLNTLAALLTGLAAQGAAVDAPEVVRLQEIKADAIVLLHEMAAE